MSAANAKQLKADLETLENEFEGWFDAEAINPVVDCDCIDDLNADDVADAIDEYGDLYGLLTTNYGPRHIWPLHLAVAYSHIETYFDNVVLA